MTDQAKNSFGAELWMGPAGGTLVKIAELTSVTPPKRSRGTKDVTTHDSPGGAQQFIGSGIYDSGEFGGAGNYIAGSSSDDLLTAAIVDGEARDFKYVSKGADDTFDSAFSGILTDYGVDELPVDGVQTFTFGGKVSGEITQEASA